MSFPRGYPSSSRFSYIYVHTANTKLTDLMALKYFLKEEKSGGGIREELEGRYRGEFDQNVLHACMKFSEQWKRMINIFV